MHGAPCKILPRAANWSGLALFAHISQWHGLGHFCLLWILEDTFVNVFVHYDCPYLYSLFLWSQCLTHTVHCLHLLSLSKNSPAVTKLSIGYAVSFLLSFTLSPFKAYWTHPRDMVSWHKTNCLAEVLAQCQGILPWGRTVVCVCVCVCFYVCV